MSADKSGATVTDLATRMKKDRVARRMSWKDYADFLGLPMTTIYKIARGVRTRPHETTIAQIEDGMARPVERR